MAVIKEGTVSNPVITRGRGHIVPVLVDHGGVGDGGVAYADPTWATAHALGYVVDSREPSARVKSAIVLTAEW